MARDRVQMTTWTLYGFGNGFDWRSTSFVEPLTPERVCSFCGLVCKLTALLPCSHSACTRCHSKCVERAHTCPLDGDCFAGRPVGWVDFPEEELAQLNIHCWNATNGCEITGPAHFIVNHFQRDCQYHVVKCNSCNEDVPLPQLDDHTSSKCLRASEPKGTPDHKAQVDPINTLSDASGSVHENASPMRPSSPENGSCKSGQDEVPLLETLNQRFRKENIVPVLYKCNEAKSKKAQDVMLMVAVEEDDIVDSLLRTGKVPREIHLKTTEPCTGTNAPCVNGSLSEVEEREQRSSSGSGTQAECSGVITVPRTKDLLYTGNESLGRYLCLLWESIPNVTEPCLRDANGADRTPSNCHRDPRRETRDAINKPERLTNGTASEHPRLTSRGDEPGKSSEEKLHTSKVVRTSALRKYREPEGTMVHCRSTFLPSSLLLHLDWLHENRLIDAETLLEFVDDTIEHVPPALTTGPERIKDLQPDVPKHPNNNLNEQHQGGSLVSSDDRNHTKAIKSTHTGSELGVSGTKNTMKFASLTLSGLDAVLKLSKPLTWRIEKWSHWKAKHGSMEKSAYAAPAILTCSTGAFDNLLPWPIKKKMVLTFLHPSDKNSGLKLTVDTTVNGRSEDYMAPRYSETGPILSVESVIATDLTCKGHIVDDKMVLQFEVTEVASSK
ncbi:hypothetical protein HPB50_008055 [Hyalomma asiaticum]|uniref:Uncharacterized protein n=1 Tax=Hyalomma asiaticum TaxID=266040 RepID=A0ACB7RJW6_HYAAI|nr:hypothetical protein HPB50_008055 [Hyalomma asiaticum]